MWKFTDVKTSSNKNLFVSQLNINLSVDSLFSLGRYWVFLREFSELVSVLNTLLFYPDSLFNNPAAVWCIRITVKSIFRCLCGMKVSLKCYGYFRWLMFSILEFFLWILHWNIVGSFMKSQWKRSVEKLTFFLSHFWMNFIDATELLLHSSIILVTTEWIPLVIF